MRIRLQVVLPLAVGIVVGGGFLLVAGRVGAAVDGALLTVPGLTRDRAVEAAMATLILAGTAVTAVSVGVAAWLARLVVASLRRMERVADRMGQGAPGPELSTPLAELHDTARGLARAAAELGKRHRRELQEQTELAALVDAVSEGIIQVDGAGRVVRANPASRTLLGLPDDVLDRPVGSLLRDESLRKAVERGARGRGTAGTEVVIDGRRILVTVSPQGGVGAVATFVDLTALRRLEEVRRDFVANASHELKTPLTSIRGYSETLLSGDLPEPERQRFLETIARNATRLQAIVDDLLDLSLLESGRWEPELEPVDVMESARRAWEPFAPRAEAAGIRFTAEVGGQAGDPAGGGGAGPYRVQADRRALEQVFTNLYDNALRYSGAGGTVRVTAERSGDAVVIRVADTGAGIPRDALPRVFERFYRADPARSRSEGGTGLGLSIVRHMVESMDGAVSAESTLGKGTTLGIRLPAAG